DRDSGARADRQARPHRASVYVELRFIERHARHEPVLLLITFADVVETPLGPGLGHGLPAEPPLPLRRRDHVFRRHLQVAENGRITSPPLSSASTWMSE